MAQRLSDNKLAILQTGIKSNEDYWYITKQECRFSNLCYIGEVLSRWNPNGKENYESFFDRLKVTPEFSPYIGTTAHRATINLTSYGLKRNAAGYAPKDLTPVFWKIREITNGDYRDTSLYQNIIDDQIEKIIIKTKTICLYPMMFTFKVLLTLGDVTGEYSISKEEFKIFVATAARWSDFFECASSIIRFRNDADYRNKARQSEGRKVANDTRLNLVVENHSMLKVDGNTMYIPKDCIDAVRIKIARYELTNPTEIDVDAANSRLAACTVFKPKQIIFFGAPGVGKSHYLKTLYPDEKDVVRVTFHPETDYSSFVGCYKPIMNEERPGEISYSFQPQAFTDAYTMAWESYVGKTEPRDIYLFIEEINRGNCAQIFGDIFQLLDRNEAGLSEYSVRPDKDLESYLCERFKGCADELDSIADGLGNGTILCLPPNLNILATMNTSDQSLFPIDSAFKRRWDWVYMPIDVSPVNEKGEAVVRRVVNGKYCYDWGQFLAEVNSRIFKITESEDKQLGFWFVKPKDGSGDIPVNDFVAKVVFYLWNDIYKDYGEDPESIFYFSGDGNPDSKDKNQHTFKDFAPKFMVVDYRIVDAFFRNLGVEQKLLES